MYALRDGEKNTVRKRGTGGHEYLSDDGARCDSKAHAKYGV